MMPNQGTIKPAPSEALTAGIRLVPAELRYGEATWQLAQLTDPALRQAVYNLGEQFLDALLPQLHPLVRLSLVHRFTVESNLVVRSTLEMVLPTGCLVEVKFDADITVDLTDETPITYRHQVIEPMLAQITLLVRRHYDEQLDQIAHLKTVLDCLILGMPKPASKLGQ